MKEFYSLNPCACIIALASFRGTVTPLMMSLPQTITATAFANTGAGAGVGAGALVLVLVLVLRG